MQRTRQVLTFLVLGAFLLLATLPLIGIHPSEAARTAWKSITHTKTATSLVQQTSTEPLDIEVLKATDPELAKAAVYALSNSLEDDEVGILFDVVQADLHPDVQKAALYAVGNHDTSEVHEFLTRVALTHEREELAKAATYALGNSDSESAVDALVKIVGSDSATNIRKAAVYALGNSDSQAAREALINVLKTR